MKKTILLGIILASILAIAGCDGAVSNTNVSVNANLKGTNTNTGYMAPANATPGPMAVSTPGSTQYSNSNMKSNMSTVSNSNTGKMMNSNMKVNKP